MKPYVGAQLLYRLQFEVPAAPGGSSVLAVADVAAICTSVDPDGSIDLAIFPPSPVPTYIDRISGARGWSFCGSDPDNPKPGTWHWRSFYDEVGPNGRAFIAEMMSKPAEWARALSTYENMVEFRSAYREQRAAAIAREWPELPPEPAVEVTPPATVLQ